MSSRFTAPPGYDSNHAAIMDLMRFGPAIWSCAQMQVLYFHAERSTAYGKVSDRHSEKQALEGIYSSTQLAWVRGPWGGSRTSWYRINAELQIDPENRANTPDGVLKVIRSGVGRGEIVEYELDWLAVKGRIRKWKEGSQIGTLSAKEGSHDGTLKGPKLGPFQKKLSSENKGLTEKEGSQIGTLQSDFDLKSDIDSQSVSNLPAREEIARAMESACGERPVTDRLIDQIRIPNDERLHLPIESLSRWMHDFCFERRARRKMVSPGLLGKVFTEKIIPWMNQNRDFLVAVQRRRELELQRTGDLKQMQSPEQQRMAEETAAALAKDAELDRLAKAKGA
ncbi:MAG TPA: hypothetical protein VGG55_02540 [Candidatus Acidoferrales bacterium]|jgi:hypothetical protein